MSDTTDTTDTRDSAETGRWLDADVDGRPVRFWIIVAVLIAAVTLNVGAWWVWGVEGGMAGMDDMDDMGMEGMPHTDVRLPPVPAHYDGQEVFFVHPAVSDPEIAETLTDMMAGSPVLVEPTLADVPDDATADVYVFANGIDGPGPLGHQIDVFPSVPGDDDHRSLREIVLVTWDDADEARELTSAQEVTAAEADGEVTLERSGVVVNAPMLTWPDGER